MVPNGNVDGKPTGPPTGGLGKAQTHKGCHLRRMGAGTAARVPAQAGSNQKGRNTSLDRNEHMCKMASPDPGFRLRAAPSAPHHGRAYPEGPNRGQTAHKTAKNDPKRSHVALWGPRCASVMLRGRLGVHGTQLGHRSTPLRARLGPFWAIYGCFWRKCAQKCRNQKMALSRAGRLEWRFRGHSSLVQPPSCAAFHRSECTASTPYRAALGGENTPNPFWLIGGNQFALLPLPLGIYDSSLSPPYQAVPSLTPPNIRVDHELHIPQWVFHGHVDEAICG